MALVLGEHRVFAVLYDGSGSIIGGDATFVEFVPANSQAAVEVSFLNAPPNVAKVELYGSISSIKKFARALGSPICPASSSPFATSRGWRR